MNISNYPPKIKQYIIFSKRKLNKKISFFLSFISFILFLFFPIPNIFYKYLFVCMYACKLFLDNPI